MDNNLWQLWITARTGLTTDIADTGTDATLPFPDALLRRLPRQSGFTPLRRACVTMLGITTVAGIAALCLSATENRQLLRHIGDDLHQFYAVPAEEFITKARRLSVLKDDAIMLMGITGKESHCVSVWGYTPVNKSASRYYAPFVTGVRLSKKWK